MRESIWFRTLDPADSNTLNSSDELPRTAEVVVVGSGLIGLATAYYLTEAGVRDVCVVDRGATLGEASGANAGGIWPGHEALRGGSVGALTSASLSLYEELAEQFDFDRSRAGSLELIENPDALPAAAQRAAAIRAAGSSAEMLDETQLREAEPALADGVPGAILLGEDGHVHPAKLAAAWVRRIRSAGGRVCANVEVVGLGRPLETSQGSIEAPHVVVAAGAWTPLVTRALGWTPPIRPIRGSLLALAPQPRGTLNRTVVGDRFYWWQLASGHVVGGGSEEDVGFDRIGDETVVAEIREDLARLFPGLANQPAECSWFGFRPYCEDLSPVVGAAPEAPGIWIAAGHFRRGVLLAPVSGKIIADLIVRGATDLDVSALAPDRFAGIRAVQL